MTPPPSPEQKPGDPTADTPESAAPDQSAPEEKATAASSDETTAAPAASPSVETAADIKKTDGTAESDVEKVDDTAVDTAADAAVDPVDAEKADETAVHGERSGVVSAPAGATVVDVDEDDDEDDDPAPVVSREVVSAGFGSGNDTLVPLAGALVGLLAIAVLLIVGFVLPATKSGPHHLPIGVAGPAAITTQVKTLFAQNDANEFDVTTYGDEAALKKAINNRDIYGGLVVTESGGSMLVSSAASFTVAETLNQIGTQLGAQVSDAKPSPTKDPRGAGLVALGLPLALLGIIPALLLIRVYGRRPLAQLGTGIAASFIIGAAASLLLTTWLGVTDGANVWLLAVGIAAAILSTTLILLGLNAVAGRIGVGIGLAVLVLLSLPLSGLSTAPEWLPQPWGDIGQFLPAGAGATLLRNAAFFDGHAAGLPLAVLGGWALVGLLLLILSEGLTPTLPEEPTAEDLREPEPAGAI